MVFGRLLELSPRVIKWVKIRNKERAIMQLRNTGSQFCRAWGRDEHDVVGIFFKKKIYFLYLKVLNLYKSLYISFSLSKS